MEQIQLNLGIQDKIIQELFKIEFNSTCYWNSKTIKLKFKN